METLSDECSWGHVMPVMWWTVFWRQTLPTHVIRNWCTTETVACFSFFLLSFFLTRPFLFLALLSVTRLHCFNSNCFKLHQFPGLLLLFSGVTPSFSCSVLYVIVTFVICYWLTLYFLHTSKSRIDQRGEHLGRREREWERERGRVDATEAP